MFRCLFLAYFYPRTPTTSTHPGLVPRRSMEVTSEAWSLLEEQEPPPGTQREEEGTPGGGPPAARLWCVWSDRGRLAKRPSAIIFSSGTQSNAERWRSYTSEFAAF